MKRLILIIICMFSLQLMKAQKRDSTWIGITTGVVRDSVYDYELPSATIAIYDAKDSTLISFVLSGNQGQFQFKQLPTGIPLKISITYLGYKNFIKVFTIPYRNAHVNMNSINLERAGRDLNEVTVVIPPVQLKGDTLEFNAAAFQLDPSAQTEDLLKLLPGVTVWSDGSITVNGKQVSSVLVDGKPFFGGNTKVATQNIPKTAVDKIQVYQKAVSPYNPVDSLTEINIRLLKNKQMGHFGKVAGSKGTNERYEADISLNFFTPLSQLSLAGASNNVNKVANDTRTILNNSTFKGMGANVEYYPELTVQGNNNLHSGGFIYQHDFIPDPTYYKKDRLTVDYFIKDQNTTLNRQNNTTTRLKGDSSLIQQDQSYSDAKGIGQTFTARYEKKKRNFDFYGEISYDGNKHQNTVNNTTSASSASGNIESSNLSNISINKTTNNFRIETGMSRLKPLDVFSLRPGDFELRYTLKMGDEAEQRINESDFVSYTDTLQNKSFNRSYDNKNTISKHQLFTRFGDFSPWIFGLTNKLSWIKIEIQNNLEITTRDIDDKIKDKEVDKDEYTQNELLTNNSREFIINEMPALVLTRSFLRFFDNRFQKKLLLEANLQSQFWHRKHVASLVSRNLDNRYQKMVPKFSISYENNQFGASRDIYRLGFSRSAKYPDIQQLVPLVDSVNQYYIQVGNINLEPADIRELSFTMNHESMRPAAPFSYSINLKGGIVNNSIADAFITDDIGRSVHYSVNANREKYAGGAANVKKAFKFSSNQLEMKVSASLNLSQRPNLINSEWNKSNILNNHHQLSIAYIYGNILSVIMSEDIMAYRSRQTSINHRTMQSNTQSTTLNANANCTDRLSLSSNISYNRNKTTNADAVKFTIWNASTQYRLGKTKNFEIKFSVLDLLRQNKGISYTGNNNMLTYRSVNVLQQYFMLTAAFFPRKFGKWDE